MIKFLVLLPFYLRVIWGILLGFCVIGLIMKKPAALYSLIVVLAAWVILRIIGECLEAIQVIKVAKDMKLPPAPPAGD
jgi:hypothetical protein